MQELSPKCRKIKQTESVRKRKSFKGERLWVTRRAENKKRSFLADSARNSSFVVLKRRELADKRLGFARLLQSQVLRVCNNRSPNLSLPVATRGPNHFQTRVYPIETLDFRAGTRPALWYECSRGRLIGLPLHIKPYTAAQNSLVKWKRMFLKSICAIWST